MKIRSHLLFVVLSALFPILVLAIVLTVVFGREQQAAFELRFLERVRAFSVALDRELNGHIQALQILAQSDALRTGDLKNFYARAARTLAVQSSWSNIILNDPQRGVQLLNLRVPFGAPLGETTVEPEILRGIARSGRPAVSALQKGRISGRYATAIIVPVQSGSRTYTLVALIAPAAWLNFLSTYPITADATMTLLDQNGTVIARTLNHERSFGKRPAPALYEQSRKFPEGAYKSIGLEGQSFYSAHSRSRLSGWTIATGVPTETVEAVLWKSIATLGASVLIAAAAALFLAYRFSRQINNAFVSLARSAVDLISGAALPFDSHTTVREASDLARAFQAAAEQLKKRAAELQESETRFRSMADTAPVLIWISGPDKRCTYFNRPWLEFTGRSLEQELGDGWAASVHPEDRLACVSGYSAAFDRREPFELVYRLRRHDGAYRWMMNRGTPRYTSDGGFSGYIGSCIDITERKEADEELRRAREELQTVTDTMSAAVIRCDADHRYLWVSPGFARWLSRPVAEIQGRHIAEIIGTEAYESLRPRIERTLKGERVEYEDEVNFRGIGRRWVNAVHTPVYANRQRPNGWVAVITDITARKRLEAALRESEQKLRQKAEDLEKQLIASGRLVSVGEVAASMAHELNNPMGIVIGFAEELLSSTDPEHPDFKALQIIHAEAQRCAKIANDLLHFGRPKDAEFASTDIASLIAKTVGFVSTRLYKSKIEAVVEARPDLPQVMADAVQIEQVLLNLFLNAIDVMPGGGQLRVQATIFAPDDGCAPQLLITVADTGTGIDEKQLPFIFQPFFTANKKTGLGLGLAISERIIRNHKGRIEVESEVGTGTTFKIYLPIGERLRVAETVDEAPPLASY